MPKLAIRNQSTEPIVDLFDFAIVTAASYSNEQHRVTDLVSRQEPRLGLFLNHAKRRSGACLSWLRGIDNTLYERAVLLDRLEWQPRRLQILSEGNGLRLFWGLVLPSGEIPRHVAAALLRARTFQGKLAV